MISEEPCGVVIDKNRPLDLYFERYSLDVYEQEEECHIEG